MHSIRCHFLIWTNFIFFSTTTAQHHHESRSGISLADRTAPFSELLAGDLDDLPRGLHSGLPAVLLPDDFFAAARQKS